MKIIILLMFLLVVNSNVYAQEAAVLGKTSTVIASLKSEIESLESDISELENFIAQAETCGASKKQYNGTACVSVNELDPATKPHGKSKITVSCPADNQALYFNVSSNSWACKSLKN